MRSQLADAFSEALADGPDSAEVLLRVRATIERRRRRRRYYRTGGVLGAVLIVLTVTAVAVTAIRDGRSAPAPAAEHIPVGEWRSTLRLGWVPDGLAVDVNGRQGYERSEPTRTIVMFPLPPGRWVEVEFGRGVPTGGPDGQPGHRDTALRIARSVDQTGDTSLRTGFAPGYLPGGQGIIGVSTEAGSPAGFGRVHTGGPAGPPAQRGSTFLNGVDGQRGPGVSISIEAPEPAMPRYAERIADIQGSPAYRLNDGQMIVVTDFHGATLTVAATGGHPPQAPPEVLPEAELIRVAEGVRWLG